MVELDKLYKFAIENSKNVSGYQKRYPYAEILSILDQMGTGKNPILLLSGLRGIGKTTILLQLFRGFKDTFYFSADLILVKNSSLFEIADEASRNGYKNILIDEIHRSPNWIDELKNIYDTLNLQVICSGSSTAAIKKGAIVLGRRAIDIGISNLTFGEYVYFKTGKKLIADIKTVFDGKSAIRWVAENDVEKYYPEYLFSDYGGFPAGRTKVFSLLKKMIYEDALAEFSLSDKKVDLAERLLAFLATSPPGDFSYTSFSSLSGYAKSTVYDAVKLLTELGILISLEQDGAKSKAKSLVKLMFAHPNLRSAVAAELRTEANLGALREEYFLFHMRYLGYNPKIPPQMRKNPDYELKIDGKELLFEIGGTSKTAEQFLGKRGIVMKNENLMVLGFVQRIDQK